jgi:hypothetical protein
MECRLAGETEVLGKNLPQGHFCPSQNPTWPDPGLNSGRRRGKPATNRLSYGAVFLGATGAWGWQPHLHLWADCLVNVGVSSSHNFMGLHGLLQG